MSLTASQYAKKTYDKLVLEGRTIVITSYVDAYDSSTGRNNRVGTDNTVVASPLLEYSRETRQGDSYEAVSVVRQGDMFTILPNYNLSFTPALGQKVTVDGVYWNVVAIKTYNHKIGTVAYELQVRRA